MRHLTRVCFYVWHTLLLINPRYKDGCKLDLAVMVDKLRECLQGRAVCEYVY